MTLEQQKSAVRELQELWQLVLPDVELPEPYTFWAWVTRFPAQVLTRAITRSAAKRRTMARQSTPMTPEDVARYCSSVARRESEQLMEGLL
jgi:hypothetical protein